MKVPIFQIDAFASTLFTGNPAAVCPLEQWLPDALLQKIAAENNLAETAYFVRSESGYHLRWFTPAVEVDLCGHATLAAAWVIMNELDTKAVSVSFQSRGGPLSVSRRGDIYTLDFPASMPERLPPNPQLEDALGCPIVELWGARDYVAVLASEQAVRSVKPSMECAVTCAKGGYGLVLGDGKFVKLNEAGNAKTLGLLKKLNKEKDLKAKISGKLQGELIQVDTIEFQ